MANGKAVMLALAFSALVTDWTLWSLLCFERATCFPTGISNGDDKVSDFLYFILHTLFFKTKQNKTLIVFIHLYVWWGSTLCIHHTSRSPNPCLFSSAAESFHRCCANPLPASAKQGSWSSLWILKLPCAAGQDPPQGFILHMERSTRNVLAAPQQDKWWVWGLLREDIFQTPPDWEQDVREFWVLVISNRGMAPSIRSMPRTAQCQVKGDQRSCQEKRGMGCTLEELLTGPWQALYQLGDGAQGSRWVATSKWKDRRAEKERVLCWGRLSFAAARALSCRRAGPEGPRLGKPSRGSRPRTVPGAASRGLCRAGPAALHRPWSRE